MSSRLRSRRDESRIMKSVVNQIQSRVLLIVVGGLFLLLGNSAYAQGSDNSDDFFNQMDADFDRFSDSLDREFENFSDSVDAAFEAWSLHQDSLFEAFVNRVDALWGDRVYPSRSDYVEYRDDFHSRVHVDFENGSVETSVLVDSLNSTSATAQAAAEVKRLVASTVVTPGTEQPYVEADKTEDAEGPPLLEEQVTTADGQQVTPALADQFAEELVKQVGVTVDTVVSSDGRRRIKLTTVYKLVPDHLKKRAARFVDLAKQYSDRYDLDIRLVMAIMHTESYFNPRATSRIPAFGLMQIVPGTAGRDAYKYVYGEDKLLTEAYLYTPVNNIELGCAYLRVVRDRYLKGVREDQLAYPCMIASYNGGIGTLCKALTGEKKLSGVPGVVNSLSFDHLVQDLQKKLPHKETRDYLARVLERMALYDEWAN